MDLMYFKALSDGNLIGRSRSVRPRAADGYRFESWNPALLDAFAEAKYLSFRSEIDANVFPCLGELDGCRRLMREIVRKPGFLPETTWLLTYSRSPRSCRSSAAPCRGSAMSAGWAQSRIWGSRRNIATAAWARFCFATPSRLPPGRYRPRLPGSHRRTTALYGSIGGWLRDGENRLQSRRACLLVNDE